MNRKVKLQSTVVSIGIGTVVVIAYFSSAQNGSRGTSLPTVAPTQSGNTPPASSRLLSIKLPNQQEPRPPRSLENEEWMAGIREAGLHGDRFRIPEMIAALQRPQHPDMIKTSLHALARLGAAEALPAIDALIRNEQADPDDRNYAVAARARLVAEYTSASAPDPTTRATAKISRLRRETGLSGDRLNAAVHNFQTRGGHSYYPEQPLEVYAMRQLADVAYREHYASPKGVPGAEDVDFSQDPASALKVKLALLPESQRASWLVQDLAHSATVSEVQGCEIQLAIDEGLPASRAAGLELQEMDKHRDQYTSNGFGALSELMRQGGDKSQLPLLEHLSHDPDPRLQRGWKLAYGWISAGAKGVSANGY